MIEKKKQISNICHRTGLLFNLGVFKESNFEYLNEFDYWTQTESYFEFLSPWTPLVDKLL